MFNKVKTKKVYMKIVEQIRDLIKEGRLKPEDKLPPEQTLAEKFGTSRPSVREALSALEILGITESRGGKGNFIKNNLNIPSYEQKYRELEEEESPFEILEARKAVETEIVGLTAKKATKKEIATIQESLHKMEGPMVAEAMRAAYILKEEYNLESRILNIHTLKPIDKKAIVKAAEETGVIITVEEHQVGGFGNIIAGVIVRNKKYSTPLLLDMIGVEDRFSESGEPWELTKVFGLTAEHIAKRAKELLSKSIDQ